MEETLGTKLSKIRSLAEKTAGGEKKAAQRKLNELLRKYNICLEDIEEEEKVQFYVFKYNGKLQRKLLIQIGYKITGNAEWYRIKHTRQTLGKYCTPSQKLEIELEFEFYSRLLDEELDIFMTAFIQKQDIFPENVIENIINEFDLNEEEHKRFMKQMQFENGIDKRTRLLMLEDGR